MRVVVVGASGRTGRLVVEQLRKGRHAVVGTIRSVRHMPALVEAGAEAALVDLEKSGFEEVVYALHGADAVVFAAGSAEGEGSVLDRTGVLRTVRAAEKAGVKRYVAISSIGASTGLSTRGMSDEMKDYYRQKRAAGRHITKSKLDWTILEPAELTDAPGTRRLTLAETAIEEVPIARADVAAVVAAVLAEPRTIGHIYQLAGGSTALRTALANALEAAAASG